MFSVGSVILITNLLFSEDEVAMLLLLVITLSVEETSGTKRASPSLSAGCNLDGGP
jgi:hypothetical protein